MVFAHLRLPVDLTDGQTPNNWLCSKRCTSDDRLRENPGMVLPQNDRVSGVAAAPHWPPRKAIDTPKSHCITVGREAQFTHSRPVWSWPLLLILALRSERDRCVSA
jgi:hypothetical protein